MNERPHNNSLGPFRASPLSSFPRLYAPFAMAAVVPSNRNPTDRNADATVHIGQLDDKVTDPVLWELMVQAAPVRHVYIPRDRITGKHFGYGFCEFRTALDAQYAAKILNMVKLYAKPIRISQSTVDRRSQDVGANLFVGNIVDEVDEKLLHDAFSAFGSIIDAPYIMRDPLTNESKRYGFVKFGSFEHSDAAIAAMDGQYICNAPISVQYAFKKDGESRERHGSQAERILAGRASEARRASNREHILRPHTMFSDRPASAMPPRQPPQQPRPEPHAVQPNILPSQPLPPGHAQPMYQYPPQPYAPPGGQIPQWQRNTYMPQYDGGHRGAYQYQQPSVPHAYLGYQAPPTAQLGWTPNRPYGSHGPGNGNGGYPPQGQQYPPQAPYGAPSGQNLQTPGMNANVNPSIPIAGQGAPKRIADESAPPPPG